MAGASLERSEADGRRLTYLLDDGGAGELVARLAQCGGLRDVRIAEPEIEDVVARLYAAAAPPVPSAPAAPADPPTPAALVSGAP